MAYLLELALDNDRRLRRKAYLLQYKGYQFKLVQDNPRKHADHLLSILPDGTDETRKDAFQIASELVSALAWACRSRMAIWECGGRSWYDGWSISKAKPSMFTFPKIPFGGLVVGGTITSIPWIKTDPQRVALTLYREARASNNDFLSFLFLWQVLETGGTNAEEFANQCEREMPRELKWQKSSLDRLPLGDRPLGAFLRDEGRNAIAHIRRKPGKKKLDLDSVVERRVFANGVWVLEALAKYYIAHNLELNDKLYLMRKGNNGFPTFLSKLEASDGKWRLAYPG